MRCLGLIVAVLACGPPPGADEAQEKLLRGDLPGAVQSYRVWRGAAGGEDRALLRALAVTTIEHALASPSVEVRVAALGAASRLDDAEFAERIAERMGDEDPVAAAMAAAALLRAHPDAPALIGQALKSDLAAVRAIAVDALGRKVGAAARAAIVPLVADPDPDVRSAVAGALGALGDDGDLPQLLLIAGKDGAAPVRASALRALARLPTGSRAPAALEAARAALAEEYLGVRLAAVQLLDRSWPASKPELAGPFRDPYTGLRAAVLLAKRGDPTPGRSALAASLASKDASLRQTALNVMAEIVAAAEGAKLARPLLRDPDPAVRLSAARALIRLDAAAEAIPVLRAALSLPIETRISVAADLARLDDARGFDALIGALLDAPGALRVTAAEHLLRLL